MLESLFNKVSRNKETLAQVFSCEFCEGFKKIFFTEHLRWSWSLSFKKFDIHKKVFEWLAANEFSTNSKNHLRFSCISISCFSIFSITCFFYLIKFLNLSMKKDQFNQIIRKWPPERVFVNLLEKYIGMSAGLWSSVCVWFWIFEKFFEELCDVIVLRG